MAKLTNEQRIIRQIIKGHGAVFDLNANPELFIEVVRKYAMDIADLANDPDGPTSFQAGPHLDDVMREVLKLQRQLAKISKQLGV